MKPFGARGRGTRRRPARLAASLSLALASGVAVVAGCRRVQPASPVEAAVQGVPRNAARFAIGATDDSTVTFAREEAQWIVPGQEGIAVDPTRRDALVARLRIIEVAATGRVRALVTGQATRVTDTHVVVLPVPDGPAWRQRGFWLGAAGGGVLGLLGGLLLH